MIELLINSGEMVAIGIALFVNYRNSFLRFLFVYVCVFTFSEYHLFNVFRPDINYAGHAYFYFIMAITVCVGILVLSTYSFLAAKILTAALCVQAVCLFAFTISGMTVFNITIPDGKILNYIVTFVNANILMFETIIAWIVATRRKG